MSTPLVIIGAGGFGREVHDVVDAVNAASGPTFDVIGFLDDGRPDERFLEAAGVPHLGSVHHLDDLPLDVRYVIGIGVGSVRRRIDEWARPSGRRAATLIHPTAVIGPRLNSIGDGGVMCANVSLTTNISVGRHVHLNPGVTIGHDAVLGDFVSIAPNASVSGHVVLEDDVYMGTMSSVIQGCRIGARTIVGAGAAVVRDLPADVTAFGVPARPRT